MSVTSMCRLGRAADAPCVSDTLTSASFAFGMIMPSGMSTSTTFTTPRRSRRLAAPAVSPSRRSFAGSARVPAASAAPTFGRTSESSVSWMGRPTSTKASFMSWRARKFGALNTTV